MLIPALKGRAKFIPTLRVEKTCLELPFDCCLWRPLAAEQQLESGLVKG